MRRTRRYKRRRRRTRLRGGGWLGLDTGRYTLFPEPLVIEGRDTLFGLQSFYNRAVGNGIGINPNPTAQFI